MSIYCKSENFVCENILVLNVWVNKFSWVLHENILIQNFVKLVYTCIAA